MRVRKGDTVIVIAGDDRGKTGKVLRVFQSGKKEGRVIVEGVNFVKRATRRSQKSPQGGMSEKEDPIDLSNVMLYCPKCRKGVRIAAPASGESRHLRACRACGELFGA
jgi:large subunit ribosomal protein L24